MDRFHYIAGEADGKTVLYGCYVKSSGEALNLIKRTSRIDHDYLTSSKKKVGKIRDKIKSAQNSRKAEYIKEYYENLR